MSSTSALIKKIDGASGDTLVKILVALREYLAQGPPTITELEQLCAAFTRKIPHITSLPPAVARELCPLCESLLDMNCPASFPKNLQESLKPSLSCQKQQIRDPALKLAEHVMNKLTPEVFWESMSDSLTAKANIAKESALILLNATLTNYPEFRIGKMSKPVFTLLVDPSPEVREQALSVAKFLYERNPSSVEKLIKTQFSNRADEFLAKVNGGSRSVKKVKEAYADMVDQGQRSNDDIEAELIAEFENPYPNIKARSGQCPFDRLEKQMRKQSDWHDRLAAIETLVSYGMGFTKPEMFVRDLRAIQEPYIQCLTDARSTLSKAACLSLVALANKLGKHMDPLADFLIPPLLGKTNHGTAVIAMSSGLAVMNFVAAVHGKRTQSVLIEAAENASAEVRLTVVKSMLIALDKWPPAVSSPFGDILLAKKRDQSDKVRAILAGYGGVREEEPAVTEEEIPEPEVVVEEAPAVELKPLAVILEQRDAKSLVDLIKYSNPKPDFIGQMEPIIELMTMAFNDEDYVEVSVVLMSLLCEFYSHHLYPFLTRILLDLPPDESYGYRCLESLGKAFGDFPIARLLMRSDLEYAGKFMLRVAEERTSDSDFQSRVLLSVISNGQYERYHDIIIFLLKRLADLDFVKCEVLFSCLSIAQRNEILPEIQQQIPQLYAAFNHEVNSPLAERLISEMERAKSGGAINFELISSVPENDSSNMLLGLAAIRECSIFDTNFIPFLMKCATHRDSIVVASATVALQATCENNPSCCALLAQSFIPTSAAFKALAKSLRFAEKGDAAQSLMALREVIAEAVSDISVKYAALEVLAKAVVYLGDEYRKFVELSRTNQAILERLISSECK